MLADRRVFPVFPLRGIPRPQSGDEIARLLFCGRRNLLMESVATRTNSNRYADTYWLHHPRRAASAGPYQPVAGRPVECRPQHRATSLQPSVHRHPAAPPHQPNPQCRLLPSLFCRPPRCGRHCHVATSATPHHIVLLYFCSVQTICYTIDNEI